MIGHFGAGPIWACVKVDECCNPSFSGTLTHIKSPEHVCECVFCHRLRVACNSGLLFYFVRTSRSFA
jgi:hypothetical protein